MTTRFDRLAVRAANGKEPQFTRRTAIKVATVSAVAASPLARAAAEVQVQLRESGCQCQKEAERRLNHGLDSALRQFVGPHGKRLLVPNNFMFATAALAGAWAAYGVNLARCGSCPSGPTAGGGGGGGQCRPRGGVCPGPGPTCPPGTSPCSDGLCCFGSDICCACGENAQCCIVEVGCACC